MKAERRTSSDCHMYRIAAGTHTSYTDVDNDAGDDAGADDGDDDNDDDDDEQKKIF